jgi:hypothetical protein
MKTENGGEPKRMNSREKAQKAQKGLLKDGGFRGRGARK